MNGHPVNERTCGLPGRPPAVVHVVFFDDVVVDAVALFDREVRLENGQFQVPE